MVLHAPEGHDSLSHLAPHDEAFDEGSEGNHVGGDPFTDHVIEEELGAVDVAVAGADVDHVRVRVGVRRHALLLEALEHLLCELHVSLLHALQVSS